MSLSVPFLAMGFACDTTLANPLWSRAPAVCSPEAVSAPAGGRAQSGPVPDPSSSQDTDLAEGSAPGHNRRRVQRGSGAPTDMVRLPL